MPYPWDKVGEGLRYKLKADERVSEWVFVCVSYRLKYFVLSTQLRLENKVAQILAQTNKRLTRSL